MVKFNKNKFMAMRERSKGKWIHPTSDQIESWVSRHFDYKLLTHKNQIRICNPDGDTKYHLWISTDQALVHDFRPNHQQWDGSFLKFVADYREISFTDAVKEVCGENSIISGYQRAVDSGSISENDDIISLPEGCKPLRKGSGGQPLAWKTCMKYLMKKRGLPKESIFKANIHFLGTHIVVPYYQYDMIVFWQMRQVVSKVFTFPPNSSVSAGDFLYGFDDVEPRGEIMITESIFDALSIGSGAVSTGGASLKDGQVRLLKALSPETVILAPDNDEAGIRSIQKDYYSLVKQSKIVSDIKYCLPLEGKDWNDMLLDGVNLKNYIRGNAQKITPRLFLGF